MFRKNACLLVISVVLSFLLTTSAGLAEPAPQSESVYWLLPAGGGDTNGGRELSRLIATHASQLHEWQEQGALAAFRPLLAHAAILLERPDEVVLQTIASWSDVQLIEPGSTSSALPAQAVVANIEDKTAIPAPNPAHADGNAATTEKAAPELSQAIQLTQFISYLGENFVEGTLDSGGVPVTLTLRTGTTVKSQVNTFVATSSFNAFFDVPIEGGDTIDVEIAEQAPVTVEVATLSATLDKGTDTMSGSGPAGEALIALAFSFYDWAWYYEYPFADASGNFQADFSDQTDLFVGDGFQLWHYDPDAYPNIYRTVLRDGRAAGLMVHTGVDIVSGYAPAGATVNLTVRDSGGGLIASTALQADSNSYFSTQIYAPALVDIDTGHQITMEIDGHAPQTLIVADVSVDAINPATDQVSGVALPLSKLEVYVYDPYAGGSAEQIVYAGGGGVFSADFSGVYDILPGSYASVTYHDNADNEITPFALFAGPYTRVQLNSYDALFVVGQPGEPISATLRNNLGAIKGSASGIAGVSGTLYLRFLDSIGNDVSTITGDQVQIEFGSGPTRTIDVVSIDFVTDRDTRTVSGVGPANTVIRFNYDYGTAVVDVTTDSSGSFSHTFLDRLTGGYSMSAYYRNQQGDDIQAYGAVPQFTIAPVSQSLYGYGPPATSVVARLEDASHTSKATSTTTTEPDGWYSLSFNAPVNVGDWVVVDAGELHFEQQVVSLTIAADTVNNLVTGTAPPDAWLNVFARRSFGPYSNYNYHYFSADSLGNFAIDFADVRGGDLLEVLYWEDGYKDRVEIRRYASPSLFIYSTDNFILGYTEPSASGAVVIRDSNGAVKATDPVFADSNLGLFSYWPHNVDIVPGDTVEISIGSLSRTVEVIPMSATIDLASETVSGNSLANTDIGVAAYHWTGSFYSTYVANGELMRFAATNSTGAFTADFSAQADLQPGDYAALFYMDEQDNAYTASFYTTNPTVSIDDYPTTVQPNQPVEVQLSLSGEHAQYFRLRWATSSRADSNAYTYSSDLQPGIIGQNVATIIGPTGGSIYFKGYAYIDGQEVWSDEHVINVSSTAATTLTDPVNGTTNDTTPTIRGVTSPDALVTLYEGTDTLATTTADASGNFTFNLSTPLASGAHELHAIAEVAGVAGPASNTIYLTVDPSLPVDPVHILLTARGQTQHLRDESGSANLGGRVWTRTGDTVSISIPISYTQVYTADLYIGGVYATSLLDSGDGVYVGSYSPPGNGTYSVDLHVRTEGANGPLFKTNILTGLIDPDGYVYDANLGLDHRIAGATVTCYELVDGEWKYWPAAIWEQLNPQTTVSDGYYAFFTLPGSYKVVVSAPGYRPYESPILTVVDAPVRHNVPLEPEEPPVASFEATPADGPAPLSVTFTNNSTGDYDTSQWNFGDGTDSDEENPVHTYTEPGVYNVSLTVTGPDGHDTVLRSSLITVYTPSTADFSANVTSGNVPLNVTFTNHSSGDYDSCTWSFGDGATSTSCTGVEHTYDMPGTYTVSLSITGNGGTDTAIKSGFITVLEDGDYMISLPIILGP